MYLNFLPMIVINVSIHSKHSAQDLLRCRKEVWSKTYSKYNQRDKNKGVKGREGGKDNKERDRVEKEKRRKENT